MENTTEDRSRKESEDEGGEGEEEIIYNPVTEGRLQLSSYSNCPTVFFQYINEISKIQKSLDNTTVIDWKDNRKFSLSFKAYKNVPDCITLPMKHNGINRTKSFLRANLIWKLLKADKMSALIKKLNKYQRFNHFPCTWQLGRKDNLWRNYKIMKTAFPDDYDFVPETYILPEDQTEMLNAINRNKEEMWLIKPVASSKGKGIRLMTNIDSIPKKSLVSNYIANPHIINNKKYDLRLYILITGFNPLKIYLYNEGLVRFACEEYKMTDNHVHNRYMHLTNYAVNKCSNNYDKNVSLENEKIGSKWSLSALRGYFEEQGKDFNITWKKIKDIIIKAIISIFEETTTTVQNLTEYKNNLFELYGFDILLDSDLRPWLLEVNLNPSLNCDTDLDLKIKTSVMTDIFNIIGLMPYSHINNQQLINECQGIHN